MFSRPPRPPAARFDEVSMSTPAALLDRGGTDAETATTFGGHPRGLQTLFFTEMWERFSYYGMRALLILYMTKAAAEGGLGFDTPRAGGIYGWYTGLVYFAALPGGFLADRLLGQRRAVLAGGLVIAAGHFCLAANSLPTFYLGLALIICGTGLLKPNVSTLVGGLYSGNDVRRDAGFSIFYMGINIGGFIAPLVCGYLAQDQAFLGFLSRHGIDPRSSWHFGFAAAGIGMLLGVGQFVAGKRWLGGIGEAPAARRAFASIGTPRPASGGIDGAAGSAAGRRGPAPLTRDEWTRLAAIAILFCFSALFWSAFEQAGSSLNLFADQITDNRFLGRSFPSSYYQSINSLFIIALAPVFACFWVRLRNREPSSPAKFAWGLVWIGAAFLTVAAGAFVNARTHQLVSPMYLVLVYFFSTLGELCLSPVGLSTVTKLAPARFAGLMMGVWFLSLSVGNKVGGWVAGHFDPHGSLPMLFLTVALFSLGAALILALLSAPIRKLMAGVH
jgi:POT family proton-dependent oligopeptide transporter